MNIKENLIELFSQVQYQGNAVHGYHDRYIQNSELADHLIANGVTIQRWIPVSERLPEQDGQYLCNYHFGEYPRMTFTRVLDYYATDIVPHFQHTLGDGSMKVTHWMSLPLPPKEGE